MSQSSGFTEPLYLGVSLGSENPLGKGSSRMRGPKHGGPTSSSSSNPRQLSLCIQGPNESTRDYLTRWAELRNSCEGVHEVQAIEYFTGSSR